MISDFLGQKSAREPKNLAHEPESPSAQEPLSLRGQLPKISDFLGQKVTLFPPCMQKL
jgi:hypothetical protein